MAAVNNHIVKFLRDRKFTEAGNFLESQKNILSGANYLQLNTLIKSGHATDYHNRFATAWNRRNYDEAERILNEGLAKFPDDRQLLSNKETIEKHNAR
jgi:hypothetical protein